MTILIQPKDIVWNQLIVRIKGTMTFSKNDCNGAIENFNYKWGGSQEWGWGYNGGMGIFYIAGKGVLTPLF